MGWSRGLPCPRKGRKQAARRPGASVDGETGASCLQPRFVKFVALNPKCTQEGPVELSACGHLSLEERRPGKASGEIGTGRRTGTAAEGGRSLSPRHSRVPPPRGRSRGPGSPGWASAPEEARRGCVLVCLHVRRDPCSCSLSHPLHISEQREQSRRNS